MRVILLCLLIILISVMRAAAQKAEKGIFLDQSIAVCVQPSGAQSATKLSYSMPLYNRSGVLWESAKIDAGLDNRLTPSYEAPFLFIDVVPIAFIDIRARAGYMQFYRALGYGFTELPSYDAEYSESKRSALRRRNKGGLWFDLAPSLRLAFGPAAFVNTFTYTRIDFGERGYFYEPYEDVVLRCTDHTFMNDTILVWRFGPLAAGVDHFIIGVPGSEYVSETASAIAVFSANAGAGAGWYAGAKAGIYLRNRYYRNQFVAAVWAGISQRLR